METVFARRCLDAFRYMLLDRDPSVNRDRAAAGLQIHRADDADRPFGLPKVQRRG